MILALPSHFTLNPFYRSALAGSGTSFIIPDNLDASTVDQLRGVSMIVLHRSRIAEVVGHGILRNKLILLLADEGTFGTLAKKYHGRLTIASRLNEAAELNAEQLSAGINNFIKSHSRSIAVPTIPTSHLTP